MAQSVTEEPYEYSLALWRTICAVLAAHIYFMLMHRGLAGWMGHDGGTASASSWYTCYLIEESLSVDNLFAFYLVFRYFHVPVESQAVVLKWGIIGAVLLRAVMIAAGAILIQRFHLVLLIFAFILIYQGVGVFLNPEEDDDDKAQLEEPSAVKYARLLIPVTSDFKGDSFFVREHSRWVATPLFLVLVTIEISDIVFAVDSVPAAFGVTEEPLVIYTANLFAIVSLRSIYSIIAHAADDLPQLQKAIGVVLAFIGFKMIAGFLGFSIKANVSLMVVLCVLAMGVLLSLKGKFRTPEKLNPIMS
eukprot:m.171079 g.171079  ORF g.171079 m.171079 type:complete len:304 (-) comp15345_c0_seq2:1231-2142(-)